MDRLNNIIENVFRDKAQILKEIKGGLTCQTYLIKVKNQKYIFQLYIGDSIYQARKKYNILKKFNNRFIPKAIKMKENKEYAYLIMEYKEGKNLYYYRKMLPEFSFNDISKELANVLGRIHNISNGDKFGWIGEDEKYKDTFIDYINSEYDRLSINFEYVDLEIRESILNKVKKAIKIIEYKDKNIDKSCLCWYDMNPSNILIEKKDDIYMLRALVDPGGARYGIPEWDIAFVKTQLCINKEEFEHFLVDYQKINSKIIDIELINALSVIVELDVMSIEIENDIIISPVPYDTSFENEIDIIHRKIIANIM